MILAEALQSEKIEEYLRLHGLSADVSYVAETGSTNADLLGCLHRESISRPVILFAGKQTAGRGTRGRKWRSAPVCLLFSIGVPLPTMRLAYAVPLITGFSVVEVLRRKGIEASVKWPNDVWFHDAKACGILCETVSGTKNNAVVIGIGLNLSWEGEAYSPSGYPCSAVYDGMGQVDLSAKRMELACKISVAVLEAVQRYSSSGTLPDWRQWSEFDYLVGRLISVSNEAGAVWTGEYGGVDRNGFLRIRVGQEWHTVSSGTVRIVTQEG